MVLSVRDELFSAGSRTGDPGGLINDEASKLEGVTGCIEIYG